MYNIEKGYKISNYFQKLYWLDNNIQKEDESIDSSLKNSNQPRYELFYLPFTTSPAGAVLLIAP